MFFLKKIVDYFLNQYYKSYNTKKQVRFLPRVSIDKHSFFEGNNSLGEDNCIKNCYIGFGTYTGYNVRISSIKIGRFCSIGSYIHNTTGNHPTSQFISTHPAFFSTGKPAGFTYVDKQFFNELNYVCENYLVEIGHDVWLADNVTILDNLKIGHGAIVGANSLVTRDIEPYSIYGGSPAKLIRYRFDEETRRFLLEFKWWDQDIEWIKNNCKYFSNIEVLKNSLKK